MIQCRYRVITSDIFFFTHYNYFRYDESAVPMMAGSAGLAMSADVRISGPGGLPAAAQPARGHRGGDVLAQVGHVEAAWWAKWHILNFGEARGGLLGPR